MHKWPIGTKEEVEALGLSTQEFRTCAPANTRYIEDGQMAKHMGCEFYSHDVSGVGRVECMFAGTCPAIGATGKPVKPFRDHGPKTVAVFLRPDKNELMPGQIVPTGTTLFLPCFLFESSLRARYENQRESGELIAISGVEGDGREYPQSVVEEIENPSDPRGPKRKIVVKKNLPIPKFPRPAESLGDVQYGRAAAAALQGEREQEIADAMAEHIGGIVGTAPLPEYETVSDKEKSGKRTKN